MLSRCCVTLLALCSASLASAADWVHWRGPAMNGHSLEKGLPADFDPATKDNVAWSAPYGSRTAPLVMGGRVYLIQGFGDGLGESERVVCLDEKSGKKLWEFDQRIYHSDIVSSRLGWAPLTGDPVAGTVFAHTTAGNLVCIDKDGKQVWERQMTEEFGRVSGYGGRITAPTFDSGLVIFGMLNSSWGDMARGWNRFVALDAKTGTVVWIAETPNPLKSTYQSNPVIAVIGGQRLLITGGGDGALHAFKVRTGERVWSYKFCGGAVNPSPVIDGNLIYCSHGEENPDKPIIGRVICVDASQIDPKEKEPKLVWEYIGGKRFGLSSPALADGVLYVPEDSGELYAFDAKSGKILWKHRYATEVRGAPLVADGKVYIFDVKGRLSIIPLEKGGRVKPNPNDVFEYQFRETIKGKVVQTETNGTPIAVNGRVYLTSRTDLLALASPDAKPAKVSYKPMAAEPESDGKAVSARLFPYEITAKPGEAVKFEVVYVDANGRPVKAPAGGTATWTIVTPGKTPTGAQPPPLAAKVTGTATEGTLALEKNPVQQGYIEFTDGKITARARVRVAAQLPARTDFDKAPDGSSPAGWVNTNGKYFVKKLPDGNNVLMKLNTDARPPLAKANGYITTPDASDYTIAADVMGTEVRGKLPDAGLINSRYTLVLDGKPDAELGKRTLRITSWEARPRINVAAPYEWQSGQWYSMKFTVEQTEKEAVIRGKIWKKGDAEPAAWTLEFRDPVPNRNGAAGLYGYVSNVQEANGKIDPGSELYFDNLAITPNGKK